MPIQATLSLGASQLCQTRSYPEVAQHASYEKVRRSTSSAHAQHLLSAVFCDKTVLSFLYVVFSCNGGFSVTKCPFWAQDLHLLRLCSVTHKVEDRRVAVRCLPHPAGLDVDLAEVVRVARARRWGCACGRLSSHRCCISCRLQQ